MRNRNLVVPLALVLALMSAAGVLLYTRNVRSEAGSGGPTTPVVVAAVDVPAGTQFDELIAKNELVIQQIPTDYVVPGAVADVEELAARPPPSPSWKASRSRPIGSRSSARCPEGASASPTDSVRSRCSCPRRRPSAPACTEAIT
jgi:hypothetical protein